MTDRMDEESTPLMHARKVAIDALMEHFANDVMDMEEFERRVETVHAAQTTSELKALLLDLPGGTAVSPERAEGATVHEVQSRGYFVTSAESVEESRIVLAILGGGHRRGRWRAARRNTAVAIFGGAELDFREAVLGPGITEVKVFTLCGGVDLVVPPGVNVEVNGFAILGAFDHVADEAAHYDPTAPTLRVTGVACMGGVDVSARHPGESARDARRRRRQLRREQRRRLRGA